MEASRDDPWHVSDAPAAYTETMMRGVVAFRMVVSTLEAAAKLSQNKNASDFGGVIGGLQSDGETELAAVMQSTATVGS